MAASLKETQKVKYKIQNLKVHLDERGWLVEMLKRNHLKDDIKQIYVATIKPGHFRASHYHKKRKEWFFIVRGEAKVFLADINTKKRITLKLTARTPKLLTVFPNTAHLIKNIGKEALYLVSAQNDIYDPQKPDTYSWDF